MTALLTMISLGLIALSLMVLYRNEKVYGYRKSLLDLLNEAAKVDISEGREWQWRFDAFHEVSYDKMVIKFWKPLHSFYPDMSFTDSRFRR